MAKGARSPSQCSLCVPWWQGRRWWRAQSFLGEWGSELVGCGCALPLCPLPDISLSAWICLQDLDLSGRKPPRRPFSDLPALV